MKFLIEPTKDAVKAILNVRQTHLNNQSSLQSIPATIWCFDLDGTEEIEIKFPKVLKPKANNAAHWTSAAEVLNVVDFHTSIYGPNVVLIEKPSTANNCGVMYSL